MKPHKRNVLAIGAHPDDVELGVGGTLAKHVETGDTVVMLVVTHGEAGPGEVALRVQEQEAAAAVLGVHTLVWGRQKNNGDFPDGSVSNYELELIHFIEQTIRTYNIDTVYTHSEFDTHQDHRSIAHSTFSAARHVPRVICYDSPSSRGFVASMYVDITSTLKTKIAALEAHNTQVATSAMASIAHLTSLAGHRGFEARVDAAEGFIPYRYMLTV